MTDAAEPHAGDEVELEELLAPILDLPSPEQREALAEICRAHPDRANALRGRHAILCKFGLASADGSSVASRPVEALRERFGPFRILRKLGRGGMGVVFLAEDPELGRQVALKLIRPEYFDSERARERFKREVGVAARLDHPGICTVYGAGEVDGQPYLALQHLRGETLETTLRAARAAGRSAWSGGSSSDSGSSGGVRLRPIALRPALELVEQLARAVHCAHEVGLVHRDLKPGNVMVTTEGRAVLMDFGLARDSDSSAVGLTGSGELVGTPIYMAPEQVAPKGRVVDRRTDVHALGVILYECLTLRPPHAGTEREELYHRILSEEPVELRRLQPAASRDLSTVVHRALAKDPARRYPSALAFAEDLRRVLDGEPTVARPPGPLRRAWVVTLRHRTLAAVGAALLIGLVASLWFLWLSLLAQRRFEALAVVARAKEVQPEDPELALEAMRAALAVAEEPEVIAAIHGVLPELQSWSLVRKTSARMHSVVWSPSRRFLVVNCAGGPAALHAGDGSFLGKLSVRADDGEEREVALFPQRPAVAFAPDESAMWACIDAKGLPRPLGICRFELGSGRQQFVGVPLAPGKRAPQVASMAWSPREPRLLVTSWTEQRCWASLHDADSGTELVSNLPMPARSWGCAFQEDGTLVLPGGLWSRDGKTLLHSLEPQPAEKARFVLVAGDRIAVASAGGVHVFTSAGAHLGGRDRDGHRTFEQLTHAEWSPEQDVLIASFQDGEVWILDAAGGVLQSWSVGSSCLAHFMCDGKRIVTADAKGRVILWDRSGHMLKSLLGHRNNAHVAPLTGGEPLVVSWDGRARIWHVDRPFPGLPFRSGHRWGRTLVVGSLLVVGDAEGQVRAVDVDGAVHAETAIQRGLVFLSLHRDQRTVWLTEHESGQLWRWDPGTGVREGPFAAKSLGCGPPTSAAHLESNHLLMANGWEVPPRTFDPERGETSAVRKLKASHVASPDGGGFAVAAGTDELGAAPSEVKLLVIEPDGETVRWLKPDPAGSAGDRASALAASRDGRYAVIGFQNGAVSVWDLDARSRIATFADHTDVVIAVAMSPDGRHMGSATRQGHLVVRQLGVDRPRLTWRSPGERFHSLSFFDDHTLVSGGIDLERLRWWWWEADRLREVLAGLTLRPLDGDQQRDLARLTGRAKGGRDSR